MMLAVATLAAALLPGASALPHAGASALMTGGVDIATKLVAAELAEAVEVDADGNNHLFFHATDNILEPRCGQVDAALYMPASIFEPTATLSLAVYVEAVTRLYNNPNPSASPLALGSCADIGYNGPSASRVTTSWRGRGAPGDDGGLMGQVCAERCQCSFQGSGPEDLPFCRDEPDQPALGRFCSLCGPTTFCPGCNPGNTVIIDLFFRD